LQTTPVRREGLTCFVTDLSDDVEEVGGVPCTTPTRTACDIARWSTPGVGIAALDAMARAGFVDPENLRDEIERWRGARYVARARYLIGACDPRSESAGESQFRLRLLDAGFPAPQLQIPLLDGFGRQIFRLDLGYEEVRWAGEYDGEQYHTGRDQEAHDRHRRLQIEREWRWNLLVVGKALVLGPSMAIEYAVGEVLGMEPRNRGR